MSPPMRIVAPIVSAGVKKGADSILFVCFFAKKITPPPCRGRRCRQRRRLPRGFLAKTDGQTHKWTYMGQADRQT